MVTQIDLGLGGGGLAEKEGPEEPGDGRDGVKQGKTAERVGIGLVERNRGVTPPPNSSYMERLISSVLEYDRVWM